MAEAKICAVDDCGKRHHALDFCKSHHSNLLRYGSPHGEGYRVKNIGPCSVDGCDKKSARRGMYIEHYGRQRRTGSPMGGRVSPGTLSKWLASHCDFEKEECLYWPFSTNGKYGIFRQKAKFYAHREMCGLANGPAPSEMHQAAHSCGNGHKGCVNPKHLRWATPKENAADTIVHGTRISGEMHKASKLSEAEVREIRNMAGSFTRR